MKLQEYIFLSLALIASTSMAQQPVQGQQGVSPAPVPAAGNNGMNNQQGFPQGQTNTMPTDQMNGGQNLGSQGGNNGQFPQAQGYPPGFVVLPDGRIMGPAGRIVRTSANQMGQPAQQGNQGQPGTPTMPTLPAQSPAPQNNTSQPAKSSAERSGPSFAVLVTALVSVFMTLLN
jgi:hypothetical protein